jgi:hypothetical protein
MQSRQCDNSALSSARGKAALHEARLPNVQRKKLGQFFTGLPLSRLLVAISMTAPRKAVIDPMAGTGDLLDAVIERSFHQGLGLERIDAIEVDKETASTCAERLAAWKELSPWVEQSVIVGSAFDPAVVSQLALGGYDLAITNPPYVRYQTTSSSGTGGTKAASPEDTRRSLIAAIDYMPWTSERHVWRAMVQGYSGLSDLSVPSWLLAAMLVKPGGVLALVAPATWRSRDYADVLQYMLARFFRLEVVVADRQPGWFSQALVRTHLVVASRLPAETTCVPLAERSEATHSFPWVEIAPEAKGGESLVGAALSSDDPEGQFAQWLQSGDGSILGVSRIERRLQDEVLAVVSRCSSSRWFSRLEPVVANAPLFGSSTSADGCAVPHALADAIDIVPESLTTLEHLGIRVSQGLRTGCNDFFYVDFIEYINGARARVRLSALFGRACIGVPTDALVPVLRRQTELEAYAEGLPLPGRLLILSGYVLPEDRPAVGEARGVYERLGLPVPAAMPEQLAAHVRFASESRGGGTKGTQIPELSAVRTNVRPVVQGRRPKSPRFWYMLPDLTKRHAPDAFVPRINQRTPLAMANRSDPVVVDANFSTAWSEGGGWTPSAISALLRSSWVRACMEAVGTPMGGGALKLEATHLKRLPVPKLTNQEIGRLTSLGSSDPIAVVDPIVTKAVLGGRASIPSLSRTNERLLAFIKEAERARQRG